jgi:hypothetical protein
MRRQPQGLAEDAPEGIESCLASRQFIAKARMIFNFHLAHNLPINFNGLMSGCGRGRLQLSTPEEFTLKNSQKQDALTPSESESFILFYRLHRASFSLCLFPPPHLSPISPSPECLEIARSPRDLLFNFASASSPAANHHKFTPSTAPRRPTSP